MINGDILKEAEEKSQVVYISNLEKEFDSEGDGELCLGYERNKGGIWKSLLIKTLPTLGETNNTLDKHHLPPANMAISAKRKEARRNQKPIKDGGGQKQEICR